MLDNFFVRNFRTFAELSIPQLAHVNLIVGRNCVGKTTLLEALWLHAARMSPEAISRMLSERGELRQDLQSQRMGADLDIASLFHGRHRGALPKTTVQLGTMVGMQEVTQSLRLAWVEERLSSEPGPASYEEIEEEELAESEGEVCEALVITRGDEVRRHVRREESWRHTFMRLSRMRGISPPPFVRAGTLDARMVGRWWDSIVLTESEDRIVSVLRLLAPVDRISLVETAGTRNERVFLVRLAGESEPQPLKSLGDGVAQMFRTVVALESASRVGRPIQLELFSSQDEQVAESPGVLLIDEIESGIHHTVLADYWSTIFQLARDVGVQIFATTHSWDCLKGFQKALAADDEADGLVIRLEEKKDPDRTRVVTIDDQKLPIVVRDSIEVR